MVRKILLAIFIIALIFATVSLWDRMKYEQSNNGVEIIMDYQALNSIQGIDDQEKRIELLFNLKRRGLTAVGIYPDSIKDLVNRGDARLFSGNEVNRTLDKTGQIDPLLASFPFKDKSLFVKIKEPAIIERSRSYLSKWADKYDLDYQIKNDQLVIFFPEWKARFINLSFGFDNQLVDNIRKLDLKVVPRITNNPLGNQQNFDYLQTESPEYVIFGGKEITGYSSTGSNEIGQTAAIMKQQGIIFGMIESFIASQKGASTLARKLDYRVLRVHSIQQAEMDSKADKYAMEGIVDRYLLAARERNVRLLYIKPFLEEKEGKEPAVLTLDYVEELTARLKSEGFVPGEGHPYPVFSNSKVVLLIISLGIMLASALLLHYLFGTNLLNWATAIILIGLAGELGLFYLGRGILIRKILALISSIVFPSLAIISQVFINQQESWLVKFIKASFISLLGTLFLSASLVHTSFLLKVDQFSGVKLSFILPILIITFYYLKVLQQDKAGSWLDKILRLLDLNIKVKHLLFLFILAVGGAVYIGRTGNFPILPVPDIEIFIRDWLEKALYVRPRFKEFLVGHPFLIATLGLKNLLKRNIVFYFLLLLGTIGQINILNTFSHTHTPLLISWLRVSHGLWLGLILGIILLSSLRFIVARWKGREADKAGLNE